MNVREALNKTEPSICIPRVFSSVTWRDVKETLELVLGKGCVDVVSKTTDDGEPFGRVFVHFRHWPKTEQAQEMRRQLMDGGFVKIVYDDPWYWKCSKSRVAKPNRDRPRAVPYIDLGPKRHNHGAEGVEAEAVEEPDEDNYLAGDHQVAVRGSQ